MQVHSVILEGPDSCQWDLRDSILAILKIIADLRRTTQS